MKIHNLPNAIREDYYTISVLFQTNTKPYTYKVHKSIKLETGDAVVIDSPSGLQIVSVWTVHDFPQINYDSNMEYKWIVCKVDKTLYEQLKSQDDIIVTEARKREHDINRQKARTFLLESFHQDFINDMQKLLEVV